MHLHLTHTCRHTHTQRDAHTDTSTLKTPFSFDVVQVLLQLLVLVPPFNAANRREQVLQVTMWAVNWCVDSSVSTASIPLFGHTKILHTLSRVGSAALAVAVPYPGMVV